MSRFVSIGDKFISHIGAFIAESAYGGSYTSEGQSWAVEIDTHEGGADYRLFPSLREALAQIRNEEVSVAIQSNPVGFAEMIAVETGLRRASVVAPGRLVGGRVSELGMKLNPPLFTRGVLAFHCLESPLTGPTKLWTLR